MVWGCEVIMVCIVKDVIGIFVVVGAIVMIND